MTAPCYDTGEVDAHGNALVDCSCPIYQGPFEIGQGPSADGPQDCNLGHGNLWSAAHNPLKNDPIDPPAPTENCIPDAPPESGCPLWSDAVTGFDPESTVCQAVCNAYQSTDDGSDESIQPGYACDSTLCTTLGIGQELPFDGLAAESNVRLGLMAEACKGIGKLPRLELIATVEKLAGCSCCASQLCGCASATDINDETNSKIFDLNAEQRAAGIKPQCDINQTLCGEQAR